jgi:hypothetical protein
MINGFQNIENWFLNQQTSDFPSKSDYVANYRAIKKYMDEHIHEEIKAMVKTFIPEMYLNNHGTKHIAKVIEKASEIIDITRRVITPYETYFLLVAIQIHDAGHLINGRKEHEKNAKAIISKFGNELIDKVEKKYVSDIARVHSGKNDPIGNLAENQMINGERINLRLLAAILRLADELADDATRSSLFLLEQELLPERSKLFHEYSKCLHSCIADSEGHQIKMDFYIEENILTQIYSDGEQAIYLIDEIYKRTLKTYLECLYCNRFLPVEFRCNSINVDIEIESEKTSIDPKKISYRLEEKGYPDLKSNDIFNICDKELVIEGQRLDGIYFCNQIQTGKSHEKSI